MSNIAQTCKRWLPKSLERDENIFSEHTISCHKCKICLDLRVVGKIPSSIEHLKQNVASFCLGLDEFLFVPIWIGDAVLENKIFLANQQIRAQQRFQGIFALAKRVPTISTLPGIKTYVVSKYHTLTAMIY